MQLQEPGSRDRYSQVPQLLAQICAGAEDLLFLQVVRVAYGRIADRYLSRGDHFSCISGRIRVPDR